MKEIIKKITAAGGRILSRAGLIPQQIIIQMDGGICSQMHFYLVGEMLARQGKAVRYNIDWFKFVGKDIDGRFVRVFDLGRMFPGLDLKLCTNFVKNKIYSYSFPYHNDYFDKHADPLSWLDLKGPLYLDGYFRDSDEMYNTVFREIFKVDVSVLDEDNEKMLRNILSGDRSATCAVHVRRGDLSRYLEAYGAPATTNYFEKAMEMVENISPECRFYLFSDEPEWCNENLKTALSRYNTTICDINGSDRGYCDLILMSMCHHQITSQGSLGKYAAMLRDETFSDGLVTLVSNDSSEEWRGRFKNVTVID